SEYDFIETEPRLCEVVPLNHPPLDRSDVDSNLLFPNLDVRAGRLLAVFPSGPKMPGHSLDCSPFRFSQFAHMPDAANRQSKLTANCELRTVKRELLFPFNRAGRLAGNVITNPVHSFDLVDDPARNLAEDLVGDPYPICGHPVLAFHHPQSNRVLVG